MPARLYAQFAPDQHERTAPVPAALRTLAREFPAVTFALPGAKASPNVVIDAARWTEGTADLYALDERIDALAEAGSVRVWISGTGSDAAIIDCAGQVLTRCQRCSGRRNPASRTDRFDAILALHRHLHDLDKPLVRADYRHALDCWQWLLRLCPGAGAAVQLAALFHDIERLASEADERIEHRAPSYAAFKRAHAAGGARIASQVLARAGAPASVRARVAALIAAHDRSNGTTSDEDTTLLDDADSLSFFSLNSNGYLDYFGADQTRKKVAWTLARMSPGARQRLRTLRLPAGVSRLLEPARTVTGGLP